MNILNHSAEDVDTNHPTAPNNCAASAESAFTESAPDRGSEEGKLPEQPKNKAHCFCPLLAKIHGAEAAAIFQGLGYKVAKSKKLHDGRKWHYDTLKALEQRWPYLRDSGIGGILEREHKAGNVFKGNYNKWGKDQTTWYSLAAHLLARATEDEGKIWFDVSVAVQCHSILAGTLYQNLRYHLIHYLAENPQFTGVPYHEVNKALLARILPWSLSSIKRALKKLLAAGLIAKKHDTSREYTIRNRNDLVVPDSMRKFAPKSGSSTDNIGSSAEMGIGSFAEPTGSSTEKTGSSTDNIGSNTDDITHYKPFERHIHKHHSPHASRDVCRECECAADAADEGYQDIEVEHGSAPVPGRETCRSFIPTDLESISHRITTLLPLVNESEQSILAEAAPGLSTFFIQDELSYSVLKRSIDAEAPAQIIDAVRDALRAYIFEHGINSGWRPELSELCFLTSLQIVVGFLQLCGDEHSVLHPTLHDWAEVIGDVYQQNETHPWKRSDAPASDKAAMLIQEIRAYNQDGWPTYSRGDVEYTIDPGERVQKAALAFFKKHPELSTRDVWRTLSDCVETHCLNVAPKGFDPLFHARRGVIPRFLFKHYETIKAEIDQAEVLAT